MRFKRESSSSYVDFSKEKTIKLLIFSIVHIGLTLLLAACDVNTLQTAISYLTNSVNVWTLNTEGDDPHYPIRLRGIAQKLQAYDANVGLIGLQQLEPMSGCKKDNTAKNGAKCLARELDALFNGKVDGWKEGHNGAIADDNWIYLGKDHFDLDSESPDAQDQVAEIRLQHNSTGYKLRLYSTRFATGDRSLRRREQAKQLTKLIINRHEAGWLPPIVVGDFNTGISNFGTEQEEKEHSVRIMEENFWRPLDHLFACENFSDITGRTGTSIDLIYIGKKSSFPNSTGGFRPLKELFINLQTSQTVEGHPNFYGQLSAHNLHGFQLLIDDKNYEPGLESLPGVCPP